MLKMYQAEVLGKLPVMQHFLFGSILPYNGPPSPEEEPTSEDVHHGHVHGPAGAGGWGDGCGIPIPSVFGAAKAEREKEGGIKLVGSGIRPVPFD